MYVGWARRGLIFWAMTVFWGCQPSIRSPGVFRAKLFLTLTSAVELFYLPRAFWHGEQGALQPKGTWQYLLGYDSWSQDHFKVARFCLFVRVPDNLERRHGRLKLLTIPWGQSCEGRERVEGKWELLHIRALNVTVEGHYQLLFKGYVKNPRDIRAQAVDWSFPLYNIAADDWPQKMLNSPLKTAKYAHSRERSYRSGLKVMGLEQFSQAQDPGQRPGTGLCHQINGQCQEIVAYQCDECAGGWYEVWGNGCPRGGDKYCGVNRCGAKGQPACGGAARPPFYGQQTPCQADSAGGICEQGLGVECVGQNQWLCL